MVLLGMEVGKSNALTKKTFFGENNDVCYISDSTFPLSAKKNGTKKGFLQCWFCENRNSLSNGHYE